MVCAEVLFIKLPGLRQDHHKQDKIVRGALEFLTDDRSCRHRPNALAICFVSAIGYGTTRCTATTRADVSCACSTASQQPTFQLW